MDLFNLVLPRRRRRRRPAGRAAARLAARRPHLHVAPLPPEQRSWSVPRQR